MTPSIAELKAEDENLIKIQVENHMDMWWTYEGTDDHKMIEECIRVTIEATKQSLSRQIAESVAGCKKIVRYVGSVEMNNVTGLECRLVPPEQKCESCKRLLKFKKERLE